jgi:hypothetical protein
MHDLGALGLDRYSVGNGINAIGQVSGESGTSTLIDSRSGWELLDASAINDAGQITGQGLIGGEYHAYLLTPVPLPGDFNGDGSVDAADYVVWRKTGGSQEDYNTWRANFGQSVGSGAALPSAESPSATVPEPAASILLMAVVVAIFFRRPAVSQLMRFVGRAVIRRFPGAPNYRWPSRRALLSPFLKLGHVLGAWATGAQVKRVVMTPTTISRTDVANNAHPLAVAWAGPVVGVVLPLVLWLGAKSARASGAFVLRFFAGFCLLANGLYIGLGSFGRVGDCGEMLRHGSALWHLWLFGAITGPMGLTLWHRQGTSFGLGAAQGEVSRPIAYASLGVCLALLLMAFAIGGQ